MTLNIQDTDLTLQKSPFYSQHCSFKKDFVPFFQSHRPVFSIQPRVGSVDNANGAYEQRLVAEARANELLSSLLEVCEI